ncbi:thiamine/thiamine pyrophosphate ABC transporter permease ThiP [Rhodobacteraceae bacterium XHP0102]|nr:thiamine/thiamine pyrophosphate ABC transporter permease ThiP [Rhodobacteraceae bacterium XHP0102]
MADRPQPLGVMAWAGMGALAVVLALTLSPVIAIAALGRDGFDLRPTDWAAIRFTLVQALLSTVLSLAMAVPLARAVARRTFWGRRLFVALMGAPFILPVIVAVFGLISAFGHNGLIAQILRPFGMGMPEIYGLHGVVLAHMFFNLPLAARLILQAWQDVPQERVRLAQSLGLGRAAFFRHIEWQILRNTLPPAFVIIFLLCCSSFAVALILGGGPRATTIELAIYQAFRFEFDLGRAASLAAIQALLCLFLGGIALRWTHPRNPLGTGLDRPLALPRGGRVAAAFDGLVIILAGLFLILPLTRIVWLGLPHLMDLPNQVWEAALRSLVMALCSTALCVCLSLFIALALIRLKSAPYLEAICLLALVISPLALGTGWFLMLRPITNPISWALPVTVLVNALMALPFVLRALLPALREADASQARLAMALGLKGWQRVRHAYLPRVIRPLGFGAGLAAALSMGDLGVIALFAAPDHGTLPLEMMRLMGAYRMQEAQGAATVLLGLSLSVYWIFDRGGHIYA